MRQEKRTRRKVSSTILAVVGTFCVIVGIVGLLKPGDSDIFYNEPWAFLAVGMFLGIIGFAMLRALNRSTT